MPEQALSRACFRPVLAATLAGAALCGLHRPAIAECLETPDPRYATEPGRWVYHTDRTTNRKCWHRLPDGAAAPPAEAPAGAPAAPPVQDQSPQGLWSRVYNGISQSLSYEPQSQSQYQQYQQQQQQQQQQYQQQQQQYQQQQQQYQQQQQQYQQYYQTATQGQSGTTAADSPRSFKHRLARAHDRPPQQPPAPATTGSAPPAAQAQPLGSDDKHDAPLNVADREALFQDFMKWQLERSMFGR